MGPIPGDELFDGWENWGGVSDEEGGGVAPGKFHEFGVRYLSSKISAVFGSVKDSVLADQNESRRLDRRQHPSHI